MPVMVSTRSSTNSPSASLSSTASPAKAAPYLLVKQHLKDGLGSGRWPPGALMPSEAELVALFGVSRMTVNRALRELQAEGLVQRSQGLGTFAAPLHPVSSTLTIHDLHDEITARGHVYEKPVATMRGYLDAMDEADDAVL